MIGIAPIFSTYNRSLKSVLLVFDATGKKPSISKRGK